MPKKISIFAEKAQANLKPSDDNNLISSLKNHL